MTMWNTLKGLVSGQKENDDDVTDDHEDEFDMDELYLDFVGDDVWEDNPAIIKVRNRLPGWHIVKVVNFTESTLRDVRSWCEDTCCDAYEEVGFYSGCSYTVGVAFSGHTDAVMFKLIWGTK
jgi:hypothetical protein